MSNEVDLDPASSHPGLAPLIDRIEDAAAPQAVDQILCKHSGAAGFVLSCLLFPVSSEDRPVEDEAKSDDGYDSFKRRESDAVFHNTITVIK